MAIYSTFFVCKLEDLLSGFRGWKLPLPKPVRREVMNPFTRKPMTIESRCPDWPDTDDETDDEIGSARVVVGMQGRYEDYLEGRLPSLVRDCPHACLKNLTQIELEALGEAAEVHPAIEDALYSPPPHATELFQIRPELISKLISLDNSGIDLIAKLWAEIMSGPDHTHSVSGMKLSDGWQVSDAKEILQPIVDLARRAAGEQAVYVLIEP